jgi:hypothetical protein
MAFRKTAMTRKNFQNCVEGFLIRAMGWHCMAAVSAANGYPDHIQHWRGEVERIIFIDLSFFIIGTTTTSSVDKRQAVNEVVAEYDSPKAFEAVLLIATKNLAARYLKRPRADLKLPDVEQCRNAFWRMVSETLELTLRE